MGNLARKNNIEHAVFSELCLELGKNNMMWNPALKNRNYTLYAPSEINYYVRPELNSLDTSIVRMFNENGIYHQIGVGELRLKSPDKLAKKRVVYFHLPSEGIFGKSKNQVFVGYEKLLDNETYLRIDRLNPRSENKGPYTRVAEINIPVFYDFRGEQNTEVVYVADGFLEGLQKEYFGKQGVRVFHKGALKGIVKGILLTENLYKNPIIS